MPNTPNGLPYPAATATPDVPRDIQALATALDGWVPKVRACAILSATQTIPHNAATPVSWADTEYDDGDMWVVGSPQRLTIPKAGLYHVVLQLAYASPGASPAGYREAQLLHNGTVVARDRDAPLASASVVLNVNRYKQCAQGDYFTAAAFHTQGADLGISAAGWTFMQATYVGPA